MNAVATTVGSQVQLSGTVIGYQVKSQLVDSVIPVDKVRLVAEECGLDEDLIYTPTRKRAAVRAAREAAKENRRFRDHIARPVTENNEQAVFGIINEQHDEAAEKNRYFQTTTVRYDKDKDSVSVEGDPEMVDRFNQEYARYDEGLTSDDIRLFIYRVLRKTCGGIALVPTGGLYFVTAAHLPILQGVHEFLQRLNVGRLWYEPKIDCTATMEWVWDAAKTEIQGRINQVKTRVSKINKRESSLRKQTAELTSQEELLKAYAELTGFEADAEEMLENISEAAQGIAAKIAEVAKK